jgi:quercetin dioxygenase-like cupin family protein
MTVASDKTGYVLAPDEGDARWHMGCLFDWKAVGEQTGGWLSIVEVTVVKGVEPPLHVHTREEEAFYVLDGEIDFQVGDDVRAARPGSFVFGPRGVPHTFALRSDTARMLIVLAPSGQEHVFHEFGEPARQRTLQPEPIPSPILPRSRRATATTA